MALGFRPLASAPLGGHLAVGAPAVSVVAPAIFPPWRRAGVGKNPACVGRKFAFLGSQTVAARQTYAVSVFEVSSVLLRNLLTFTEQFDNAVWTKTAASVTANATAAPDGTSTADKIVEASGNAAHYVTESYALAASTTYSLSVTAKAAERSWLLVDLEDLANVTKGAYFNLAAGALGDTFGSGVTSAIIALGGGWYRCSISIPAGTGAHTPSQAIYQMVTADGGGGYAGDGTSGLYVWGAQLEAGALTAYQSIPLRSGEDISTATEVASASATEGSASAADTSAATVVFASSIAEGSATASDTNSVSAAFVVTDAEGSATATDTESVLLTQDASDDEGSTTATDTQSAAAVFVASDAEGSASAADTQDYSRVTPASCDESGSAADTESATAVFAATSAEGASTSNDASSCTIVTAGSVAEGTASAQDTLICAAVWAAFIAEGSSTAVDAQDWTSGVPVSDNEGSATAADNSSVVAIYSGAVAEGSATMTDTPIAVFIAAGSISEGTASAADLNSALAAWSAAISEGSASAVATSIGFLSSFNISVDLVYIVAPLGLGYRVAPLGLGYRVAPLGLNYTIDGTL